jgi:hypothetical protein
MTSVFAPVSRLAVVLVATALAGCGGAQAPGTSDPVDLLLSGDWEGARRGAAEGGTDSPEGRAVVALSHLAQSPGAASAAVAVEVLSAGPDAAVAEAAATTMLALLARLDLQVSEEVPLLAVEAALGAVGLGPLARSSPTGSAWGPASRGLAVAVLERLSTWVRSSSTAPSPARLLDAWNGAYTLLGGSPVAPDAPDAWRLYSAAGWLAVIAAESDPDADLSGVLLDFTVRVVEGNESIVVAVRCDISSPFDRLRPAIARDRKLLGRLERAVASASGCSRGTYAPTAER